MNSTQLNGYNYTLSNSYFKTFLITLLSLILLFLASCSNEGTTGWEDNSDYFYVSQDYNNRTNEITVISESYSSRIRSAGHIGFTASSSTISTTSIESVANNSGSALALEPSHFEYSESTKKLTLSYSGLNKFQTASASLTAKQKYQYTIKFKFTDYSGKETTTDVTLNLIKAQIITKTDIENMMKAVKNSDGIYGGKNNGEIVFEGGGVPTTFSFASVRFSGANPNFSSTSTTKGSETPANITASSKAYSIATAIARTAQFKEYFGSSLLYIDCASTPPSINGKDCTFTIKFKKLQSGYALSSDVSRLTTTGLTIKFTIGDSKANWK